MDRPYRPDRDRDRDREYRDRDRGDRDFRDRPDRADRDFHHHQPRRPSRFSDGPPPRGGFSSSRRAFDSPPRLPPGPRPVPTGFDAPPSGGPPSGFWQVDDGFDGPTRGGPAGYGSDFSGAPPRQPRDEFSGPPPRPRNEFSNPPRQPRDGFSGPPQPRNEFSGPPPQPRNEFSGPPRQSREDFSVPRHPRNEFSGPPPPQPRGELPGPLAPQQRNEFSGPPPQPMNEYSGPPHGLSRSDFSGPPPSMRNEFSGPPPSMRNEFSGPPPPMRNEFSGPPPPPQPQQQLSGQKRGFPSPAHGGTPEHYDGRSFVKLFVGSVPRTATEEEIRPFFEEQGKVLEVALIKDKRTGQQQGCCFIKYATSEEADRAIRALHNQYTLPGGVGPVQVRYADGERERLGNGAVEYKLFVGSLNKFATEKEVEEMFAPYGHIEDVYLMRDERKQSRGCGFVKFSDKDSAMGAINALSGIYTMRGCDQPLTVRFADPKRPRAGEQRANPAFGGPGFGPSTSPVIRPVPGPNFPGLMGGQGPPNAWQPMSPQNTDQPHFGGIHEIGKQLPPRSGEAALSSTPGGHLGPQGSVSELSAHVGAVSAPSTSPQNFNQSFPHVPQGGKQISPLQKPLQSPQQFPPALQPHQGLGSYSQGPTSQPTLRPFNQPPSNAQTPYGQPRPLYSSQQLHSSPGQLPQFQLQQSATSSIAQPRPNTASSVTNSQLPTLAPQQPFPYQQAPSQLAQMLLQQTQTLQARDQSSQQAMSQLQQQWQMMQSSTQNQPSQENFQASKQQSHWPGATATAAASAPPRAPTPDAPSTSSAPIGPMVASKTASLKCSWTEHTSPDGYKYYYNSATGESKWLKPEELTLYEQQQQKLAVQQPQAQPSLQAIPTQQVSQPQQSQLQTQFRSTEQLQHPSLSSMYQTPRGVRDQVAQETTYPQLSAPVNAVNDPARFQQGFLATQDWAWKSKSGGK